METNKYNRNSQKKIQKKQEPINLKKINAHQKRPGIKLLITMSIRQTRFERSCSLISASSLVASALLQTNVGLRSCPSTTIKILSSFSERRQLLPGELLFEAGDGVDEHIFVLSGQLQITKPRTDGAVNLVATVGAVRTARTVSNLNLRHYSVFDLMAHM